MNIRRFGSAREMISSSDVADLGGIENTLHVNYPEQPKSDQLVRRTDAYEGIQRIIHILFNI